MTKEQYEVAEGSSYAQFDESPWLSTLGVRDGAESDWVCNGSSRCSTAYF